MTAIVEYKGLDKFTKALQTIYKGKFFDKLKIELSEYLRKSTIEKINTQNLQDSHKNKPLTLKNKTSNKQLIGRTNRLLRNIGSKITKSEVIVGVRKTVEYASIHQTGGVIKPINAEKLTIPANKKVSRMAIVRGIAGVIEEYKAKGAYIIWKPKSVLALWKRKSIYKGQKYKMEVLFFRKDKIIIPKRSYLYISKRDQTFITKFIRQNYQLSLSKAA